MQLNAERGKREGVERERECKHACVVWGPSGGPQKREVLVSCDVAAARVRVDGADLGQREKEGDREGRRWRLLLRLGRHWSLVA